MKPRPGYSRIALVALIIVSATIGWARFDSFQVGAYFDDAHYVVLAESLASGRGYRESACTAKLPAWSAWERSGGRSRRAWRLLAAG